MPGKEQQDQEVDVATEEATEPEETEVSIGEKTWTLKPMKGLKSFHIVPRIMRLASKLTYAAGQANINFGELFGEDGFDFEKLKAENLLAFDFIGEVIVEDWPEISGEILPILLGQPRKWLWENGTFIEHVRALWKALLYHGPELMGKETWDALKKSLSAPTQPEEEPDSSPETPSESSAQ